MSSRTIIFAGAGTAGHVEPALAVARAWNEKYPQDRCVFLGTPTGLENTLVPVSGFELRTIQKVVMPRSLNLELLKLPLRLFRAVNSAKKIIGDADLLIGFGGYVSASAYIAAFLSRVPIVVHEANAKVGWANQLGSMVTKNLAIARPILSGRFSRANVTGLPLRADVRAAYMRASKDWRQARNDARSKMGWSTDHPTLLILGGSQGSAYINSQIARALPALRKKNVQILHSVGANNVLPENSENYRAVPYINDMAAAYLAADVVLARSGAVTCAEFAALGRMAVFIPLPIGNGEQARNADQLVSVGRAIVVPQKIFSARWLENNIDRVIEQGERCAENGLDQDMESEQRIIELMENTLQGKGQ